MPPELLQQLKRFPMYSIDHHGTPCDSITAQQVLTYGRTILIFQTSTNKMGLKKNGKKVRLQLHESVDSQESLEMDEYSDDCLLYTSDAADE